MLPCGFVALCKNKFTVTITATEYLVIHQYNYQKINNASNVKIRAIAELQEWPFTTANSSPINLNTQNKTDNTV